MHNRDPRDRSEGLNSPLRPALSYSGHNDMNSPTSPLNGDSNAQGMMSPYSMAYSYPQTVSGFAATATSRMRPFGNNMPRRIEVGPTSAGSPTVSRPNQYSPTTRTDGSPSQSQGPQSATFPHFTSNMSTSHSFSMMSAPHHITSFPGSNYMRQDETSPTHDSYGDDLHDDNNDQNGEGITTF